ncbi:MAG: type I 3-dehydroquinate dehydratase [Luteolibacter sp.]
MQRPEFPIEPDRAILVGGFARPEDLQMARLADAQAACDVVEIRLDLIFESPASVAPESWAHLAAAPLLFTARRASEGGHGQWGAAARMEMLERALHDAAAVDVEVASIPEMNDLLAQIRNEGLPWIASYHDFEKMPHSNVLHDQLSRAADAGASIFKVATWLHSIDDMVRLAEFQMREHPLPVASMGMGPLAAVSRLLCAQCGSKLSYGYLGSTATAPGQWSAHLLREAISKLPLIAP